MTGKISRALFYKENNIKVTPKVLNEQMFTKDSVYPRSNVKFRLITDGLIPYTCAICGCLPLWRNKDLTLVLDHINGVNNDNRISNLRFLCPNCNSQTETFSMRLDHRHNKFSCEAADSTEEDEYYSFDKKIQPLVFGD